MAENKLIFHIDVNSAFLSWEASRRIKENPESTDIRTIPSVIGGNEKLRHGIVLAKSVSAKKYGIQTGESLAAARKKCPALQIFSPDFELYVDYSDKFIEFLKRYAPTVEQYSIDEAFCDMTGTSKLYGDPVAFAHKLKSEIHNTFGFTVNIGISSNHLLAKMASDFEKPDKVHTLFPSEVPTKMWQLPASELFSVGKSTLIHLNELGLHTIGDIARCDKQLLISHFKKHGEDIWNYANGIDSGAVSKKTSVKSYGNSMTIHYDVTDRDTAKMIILSLCETIGARIRGEKAYISVISVSITDCDFNQKSKQCTLNYSTNITEDIFSNACRLFDEIWCLEPIRLIGVSTSHAVTAPTRQTSLFDVADNEKLTRLNNAVDQIREKFGEDSIKRARFIGSEYNHMTGGLNKEQRKKS